MVKYTKLPVGLTPDVVIDAIENYEGVGFCLKCGFWQYGCEPDARGYECDECGEKAVYGAEEIMVMGLLM